MHAKKARKGRHAGARSVVVASAADFGASPDVGPGSPEEAEENYQGRSKRRILHRSVEALGDLIASPPKLLHFATHRALPYAVAVSAYIFHWGLHEGPFWQRPFRVALAAVLLLQPLRLVLTAVSELFWGVVTLPEWWQDAIARVVLACQWLLVFWPQLAALGLGGAALLSLRKGVVEKKPSTVPRQLLEVFAALTWLVLVPAGIFLGSPNGWPLGLFLWYILFFGLSAGVRFTERRKWEEGANRKLGPAALSPREIDAQWATKPRRAAQLGFIAAVVGGHWLAMVEASLFSRVFQFAPAWTKWVSGIGAFLLLYKAFLLNVEASQELGIYYDRLVVPKALITSGPYREVRHPIYVSYMVLFAGYAIAMGAPVSLGLMLFASYVYYEQRTAIEEGLLEGKFGEEYQLYKRNTWKYWKGLY